LPCDDGWHVPRADSPPRFEGDADLYPAPGWLRAACTGLWVYSREYRHNDMPAKRLFSFRLDPDLVARFDARARREGALQAQMGARPRGGDHGKRDIGRTAMVETLMALYVEGRLAVLPAAGANAFPAEEVAAGDVPEHPILITAPTWFEAKE
jgi:hypothetical protein